MHFQFELKKARTFFSKMVSSKAPQFRNCRAIFVAIFVCALFYGSSAAQGLIPNHDRWGESFVDHSELNTKVVGVSIEQSERPITPLPIPLNYGLSTHTFSSFGETRARVEDSTNLDAPVVSTFRNFVGADSDGLNAISEPVSISNSQKNSSVCAGSSDIHCKLSRERRNIAIDPVDFGAISESGGQVGKIKNVSDDDPNMPPDMRFQWGPAIRQSLIFLAVQHGFALTQPRTQNAIKDGNFFVDYYRSLKSLHGWDDGGKIFTNYVAHPMQGATTGFIFIQNDPKGRTQQFGSSHAYWRSRTKALLWAAAWSSQFELGPLSQASIGNVGLSGKQAWVDIVITPTFGTGWLIIEDVLDRYLIKSIERRNNFALKIIFRILANPMRTAANLVRFKQPWYRDRQPGH